MNPIRDLTEKLMIGDHKAVFGANVLLDNTFMNSILLFIKINNQDITIDEKKLSYEEILGFGYFEKLNKEYLVFETSSIAQKYILVPLKKDKDKIFEFLRIKILVPAKTLAFFILENIRMRQ